MSRGLNPLRAAAALIATLSLATHATAEPLRIGGTGAGIAIVGLLAEEYMSSYPDQRIEVLAEQRRLRLIPIDGVWPTVENLESGAYPFVAELHPVLPGRAEPAARQFVDYVLLRPARDTARSFGAVVDTP
ncbi:MAG: hypothetical protein L6R19_08250 [Alphaproteobacteria bacterium]|nr:hypothetical protein [Alphaproteobacteria bacterium]